ncbi:MAG: YraN family protein [Candidatus Spechtbacterales bacterium]
MSLKNTGEIGEDVAVKYAKQQGWKILARNFRKPWGEIDIVARDKKKIIFIEVKAMAAPVKEVFRPEVHFNPAKKQKLIRTCHSYLLENKYNEDTEYRIDLAAVEIDKNTKNARVRYYKNV